MCLAGVKLAGMGLGWTEGSEGGMGAEGWISWGGDGRGFGASKQGISNISAAREIFKREVIVPGSYFYLFLFTILF